MTFGWQYEVLKCPFCDKGEISCKWYPSATTVKKMGRTALGSKGSVRKSKEVWLVISDCGACGKTKEEIEKELRKKNII